jgi:hypothetical protein
MTTIKEAVYSIACCLFLAAVGYSPDAKADQKAEADAVSSVPREKKTLYISRAHGSEYTIAKINGHLDTAAMYELRAKSEYLKAQAYMEAYKPSKAEPYLKLAEGWMSLARTKRQQAHALR